MGKETRTGYGYGMSQYEAERSFIDSLNSAYGEDEYQGGGNDITEWLTKECIEKPVTAQVANKVKTAKHTQGSGKLVNGFRVTNDTRELQRLQISAQFGNRVIVDVVEEYAIKLSDAKKIAERIALKHNAVVHIIPCRLWEDEQTKRLSMPARCLEVNPTGGKAAKPGTWKFEVEVKV